MKQWQLFEEHFNQADLGGEASKPTTAAGDLPLKLQPHLTKRKKYVSQRVHDSKSLSRWSCGFMNAVAQKHFWREIFKKEPIVKLKAVSWEQHVQKWSHPLWPELPHMSANTSDAASSSSSIPTKRRCSFFGHHWTFQTSTRWRSNCGEVPAGWCFHMDVPENFSFERKAGRWTRSSTGCPWTPRGGRRSGGIRRKVWNLIYNHLVNFLNYKKKKLSQDGEDEEGKEEREDFEVRTFRMVAPMPSKSSSVVAQAAMEMYLRLRSEGFVIHQIHTDKGGEFSGYFRRWVNSRGLLYTSTPGDDPRGNGRAERAVQAIKQGIRRVLHGAEAGHEMWPWAARYLTEVLAAQRNGKERVGPSFLAPVLCRKRRWKGDTLGTPWSTWLVPGRIMDIGY